MSIIEPQKKRSTDIKLFLCYNCGIEIIDQTQKHCPNCNVILNPNSYINWRTSWYSFVFTMCVIPILIAFFFVLLSNP